MSVSIPFSFSPSGVKAVAEREWLVAAHSVPNGLI
ncbi:hypothetical protein Vspart_00654 [Vibrio spartinae]|uniref:Uncharacterized protein n=1 Tax=Vibrio spartinae TaxID=1918945 RepID=A0ABX6QW69_9VIBR|nr:hypothetical protein Vspart_00654 [Vibrio spartinae]